MSLLSGCAKTFGSPTGLGIEKALGDILSADHRHKSTTSRSHSRRDKACLGGSRDYTMRFSSVLYPSTRAKACHAAVDPASYTWSTSAHTLVKMAHP